MIGRLLGSDRDGGSGGGGTDGPDDRGDGGSRRALVFALLALPVLVATYILLLVLSVPRTGGDELRLDQFYAMLDQGRIRSATMLAADSRVTGRYDRGRYWTGYVPSETQLGQVTSAIQDAEVPLEVDQQATKQLLQPLTLLLPALILVDGFIIIVIIFRGGREVFNFGKSGARRFSGGSRITFDDVAGLEEAIEELQEIRDYLADPDRFMVMGAAVPKGILLTGPPGCGKTLLARAVAGESDVPFFNISGSDFVEMFVGVGAARIRDLFRIAKEEAPAIVFIDELDAVGRGRRANAVGGQDEREATLNQLLVELDGFESGSGVVVLAATNRVDVLDKALLRPGRFDRRIPIDRPDVRGREGILRIHSRGKPLAEDVDLARIARRTPGFSGADLANIVNEGALLAARRGETEIGMAHLVEAIERVIAGPERKSRIMSEENRRRLGVHEAGHAVVSAALPSARAVEKVSIVSRGHAGGFTWYLPDEDQRMVTRAQLRDRMTSLLAGRAAEEMLTGDLSSGAQRDLSQATRVAREMVGRLGMSDRLGPLSVEQTVDAELDGHLTRYSEELLATIDEAVVDALDDAEGRARRLLGANAELLEELADELVAEESLEGEALQAILDRVVPEPRLMDAARGDREPGGSAAPGLAGSGG